MKQNISLYLALAGTLLVGTEAVATKYPKGKTYADAAKQAPSTTILKIVSVQSSIYQLDGALKRKRAHPEEAFEQYKNEPAQRWEKAKKGSWVICQGPVEKPSDDNFEVIKRSHAQRAAEVLSKLIDPLHAKHGEYAQRTDYAKKETAIIGQGKKSESHWLLSYWPFS